MPGPLDGSIFGPGQPCFGCSPDHPTGFRLKFERDGDEVVSWFTPGDRHQGPPGIMHGGLVTTLADEVGAWAVIILRGQFGFTTRIEATLRRPVRTGLAAECRSRITRDVGRLITSEVRILQDGELCYEASLRFAILDAASAERLLGGPLPQAWTEFTR